MSEITPQKMLKKRKKMLSVKTNFNLESLNTFKLESTCAFYSEISHVDEVKDLNKVLTQEPQLTSLFKAKEKVFFILGGGSNLIFRERIHGLVLKNNLKGIKEIGCDTTNAYVQVASGEVWHDFVLWCLDHGYFGLENLALIPGTVGAAPIQNIGAYGVEVKKFIHSVRGRDLLTSQMRELNSLECQFSYRDSIFKKPEYKNFFITEVVFKFPLLYEPEVSYGELKEFFKTHEVSPRAIANKVIEIRKEKLPSLDFYPNVGSFFKNPLVTQEQLNSLKKRTPQLVSFPHGEKIKLSAGQLIELAGFKGQPQGAFMMYSRQALVMINQGGGRFEGVMTLAEKVKTKVLNDFGVILEIEPDIW